MKSNRRYPSSTEVARLAGVSQSAVSRAFSEGKSISEETRRKVFEAADKLHYSPNFIPRILLNHRSHLVAVVISGTSNPFYASALDEFTDALQESGYQVLLVRVDGDHALDGVVTRLASYRVDAIVSALPVLSREAAKGIAKVKLPTISFNTPIRNRWVTSVCSDGASGANAVAGLFVKGGARTFGFVGGLAGSPASIERFEAYKEALRQHGFMEIETATGDYRYDGGFDAIVAFGKNGKLPDAIFCANDLMAIGGLDALRGPLGLRVPEDIMIAGFDDIPQASWNAYDLTTVVQDAQTMVAEAMTGLRAMMSSSASTGGILRIVPAKLIERSTTR
ncbi:MAG: LacI family DNA-binding transcriptional regulator [Hyphomicrobiales bacterium]|nr:LacI family DNA-binding transcriptional regulator [Hyphomicrobiales bacterium]